MAKLLKLRRGTTTQHASFTGAEGELTVDITKDTAVVHDGSQAGGRPLAREDMSNVSSASIAGRLGTDSIATTKIAAGALPTDVTVASANIVDGSIVNADIASNAAIAGTKLENSGVTAGAYGSSSAIPIVTVDAQGLVTAASTTAIDSTTIANGSSSVSVANNGAITSNANHDFSAGIDVTGEIITDKLTITDDGSSSPIVNIKTDDGNPWGLRLGNDAYSSNNAHGMMAYLNSSGEGYFAIVGNGVYKDMHFSQHDGATNKIVLKFEADDQSAELYAGGSKKFETDSSGITVTGNIAVSGTVDGVDIAALKTAKDSLSTSNGVIKSGVELASGVITSTQAQSDNTTKVATTAYVRTAISQAQAFPSGTKMLFQQTSAPTGWTKITSGVGDKALRVVTGTVGSGGTNAFSNTLAARGINANAGNTTQGGNVSVSVGNTTAGGNISVGNTTAGGNVSISSVSTSGNVNSHTLSTNEMPSHSHRTYLAGSWSNNQYQGNTPVAMTANTNTGGSARGPYYGKSVQTFPLTDGGGGGHSHGFSGSSHSHNGSLSGSAHNHNASFSGSAHNHNANASFSGSAHNHSISVGNLDMAVQYLDVIIAQKD